jgi:hypothetical protein
MLSKTRKLSLVQPENIAHRGAPPIGECESQHAAPPQDIYGSEP